MDTPTQRSPAGQYVTFFLGDDEYGLDVWHLREITPLGAVTRVPGMPRWVRGVVNLRGSVVPVIDLGLRFGHGPREATRFTCVIVVVTELDGQPLPLGVVADRMGRVLDLGAADIQPPPPFGTRVRLDYLLGLGRADPAFVLLLDVERVLSLDELIEVVALGHDDGADAGGPADPPSA